MSQWGVVILLPFYRDTTPSEPVNTSGRGILPLLKTIVLVINFILSNITVAYYKKEKLRDFVSVGLRP
jgi:hypothetical protein